MAIGGYTDPREGVNLGQANTGQAVVLGGYHDPLEEAKGVAFRQKAEADKLAAQKKAADEAQKKELLSLVPKVEYFMNADRDLMRESYNNVLKYMGALGQEGRAARLSDPSSQERIQYEQIMAGNASAAKKSQNDLAWWEGFYKQLQDNPDNFTPEAIKAAYDWAAQPYTTRGEPPQLDKYFDEVAHQNKVAERLKEMEMTSGAGFADDGRTIAEYTKSYISPERAQDSAIASYEADPRQKKRVDERYSALPSDQKDALLSEGLVVNTKRKAAGLPPLTPQQYLHYKEAWKAREVTQQQVKKEQVSEGNYGIGAKQAAADELIQKLRGLGTGNYTGMEWTEAAPTVIGAKGAAYDVGMKGLAVSDALSGFKFGNTRLNVSKVAYNPETKKMRIQLTPSQDVTESNPLSPNEEALSRDFAKREYDVDELVSQIGVPIVEGNKEYDLPSFMRKLADMNAMPVDAVAPIYEKFPGGEKRTSAPSTQKKGELD